MCGAGFDRGILNLVRGMVVSLVKGTQGFKGAYRVGSVEAEEGVLLTSSILVLSVSVIVTRVNRSCTV